VAHSPPGWYPDPSGVAGLRYFDGTAWTSWTNPAGPRSEPPPARSRTPWIIGGVAASLAVVLVAAGLTYLFVFYKPQRAGLPFGDIAPSGLAVDSAGNVYTASGTGVLELSPGAPGSMQILSGDFGQVEVAVDAAGNLYVPDRNGQRILKLAPGSTSPTTLPFGAGLSWPVGVAVDAAGTVYVADSRNNRVLKLTVGGTSSTLPFKGLHEPLWVAVDSTGNVYVTQYYANTVLKFPPW
jgi:DNA-binding beta-propeller fold protein YncE